MIPPAPLAKGEIGLTRTDVELVHRAPFGRRNLTWGLYPQIRGSK
jgi:hypothetical protein